MLTPVRLPVLGAPTLPKQQRQQQQQKASSAGRRTLFPLHQTCNRRRQHSPSPFAYPTCLTVPGIKSVQQGMCRSRKYLIGYSSQQAAGQPADRAQRGFPESAAAAPLSIKTASASPISRVPQKKRRTTFYCNFKHPVVFADARLPCTVQSSQPQSTHALTDGSMKRRLLVLPSGSYAKPSVDDETCLVDLDAATGGA